MVYLKGVTVYNIHLNITNVGCYGDDYNGWLFGCEFMFFKQVYVSASDHQRCYGNFPH